MNTIRVIMTMDFVYTVFNETIHYYNPYVKRHGQGCECDRYNDRSTCEARSLAFSLASTSLTARCETLDWSDRKIDNLEMLAEVNRPVFNY